MAFHQTARTDTHLRRAEIPHDARAGLQDQELVRRHVAADSPSHDHAAGADIALDERAIADRDLALNDHAPLDPAEDFEIALAADATVDDGGLPDHG
jgi:hypothetical protein